MEINTEIMLPLINKLIKNNLDKVNKKIEPEIKRYADPAGGESSDEFNAGSIDLGICTANANVSYHAKGLTGLSNSKFLEINILNMEINSYDIFAIGRFEIVCDNLLSADAEGRVHAGCGFVSDTENIGIAGEISGYKITGELNLVAEFKNGKLIVKSMNFFNSNINIGNVDVKVTGLGIFDSIADAIVSQTANTFSNLLYLVKPQLMLIINKVIESKILPLKINVD